MAQKDVFQVKGHGKSICKTEQINVEI